MSTSTFPLPKIPETVLALPTIPETRFPLPRIPETVIPAGTIPYIPPRLEPESSSTGTSSVDLEPIHFTDAESSSAGSSSVDLLPIKFVTVESESEGSSTAVVTDDRGIEVTSTTEGSSLVEVSGLLVPESVSEGSSSVSLGFDAVSTSEGDSTVVGTMVGILNPVSTSEGTSTAEVKSFTPSGMTKSGQHILGSATTEVQITGWAADAAYPGSTISGNDLVVQTDGTGVTVSASIELTNRVSLSRSITLRLRLAGTEIATSGSVSFTGSETKFVTVSASGLTVAQASLVRASAQQAIGNSHTVTDNPASYVRVFKP